MRPTHAEAPERSGIDAATLKKALVERLVYGIGKDPIDAQDRDWLYALAYVVRDQLIRRWMDSMRRYYLGSAKRVYYLSMEFLIGRALTSNLISLGMEEAAREAVTELGLNLERLCELEDEAALGNGGLGRLAACFLDSLATLQLPGFGYGIRYEYGMFSQRIENGCQVEHPDPWLRYGNPWEFPRPDVLFRVQFGGNVSEYRNVSGETVQRWDSAQDVMAMAYDIPSPGYGGATVNNIRLWSAKASREFDLKYFNEGNYIKAVEQKTASENLSKVLYPDDTTIMGRELRLKQQYFFVSATLQDILQNFCRDHDRFDELPNSVAIQLNDTHPAIAIPELMRLLVDLHGVAWDHAWQICVASFSYTNHTLLPEALETWPVRLFELLLPRHLQIIYRINDQFLTKVGRLRPGDSDLIRRVSLIAEEGERRIRMAYLAVIGSHRVNGVAKLHSELMVKSVFRDFADLFPDRFLNITNGVTPRRWLRQSNAPLARLITGAIGGKWVSDLGELQRLVPLADDRVFLDEFNAAKSSNKERVAESLRQRLGVEVNPGSLFDVQIKRIHEYKRQILNLLQVISRYNRLRAKTENASEPRTVIFGGKAAPGYFAAKLIIRLINDVAEWINHDQSIADRLKVVFVPNYNVSAAMELIPAAELSEQISTAGMEASGTSNMKMMMNGALTIGTLDGANVEIADQVGPENIFIFGHTAPQLETLRQQGYDPWRMYYADAELKQAIDMIANGYFSPDEPGRYGTLVDGLLRKGDPYFVLADYRAYVEAQQHVDTLYRDRREWARRALMNVARSGDFSSDRAIQQYAARIWEITPVRGLQVLDQRSA